MINKSDLSKIGMGTWGIGGFAQKNPENDDQKQITALTYMFDHGVNFIELNQWTSEGHSVELVRKALEKSTKSREDIFISQAVYAHSATDLMQAQAEVDLLLSQFDTDYVDVLCLGQPSISSTYGNKETISFLQENIKSGKTRYIGLNNPSLNFLKEYYHNFKSKLFSAELCYNFEIRENKELGTIDYANQNDILCVVYQPLRRNRTAQNKYDLLVRLSKKYKRSQNQIILNWISSKGLLPLTKSETISHIDEHLSAFDFIIDESDLKEIDNWKNPSWKTPKIDWEGKGDGINVSQLSNVYDEMIKDN